MIDIRDPKNPVFAGCYDQMGYTHDAQCVIYDGPDATYRGKEICFNANEDDIVIADVTDKSNPQTIKSVTYKNVFYAHQGWLTDDHRYFISNDELDELNTGTNTKTLIWDMQDLDNPVLVWTYRSALNSIDHNLYVKGGLVFQSNYTAGLRLLDITGIASNDVKEVGFFDTYTFNDDASFDGSWSNYPYFESGNVIISDRQNGLFVVKPTVTVIPPGTVTGLDDNDLSEEAFLIFPNPAQDVLNIDYLDSSSGPTSVNLYDGSGRLVMASTLKSHQNNIEVGHLNRGIYYLKMANQQGAVVKRIALR